MRPLDHVSEREHVPVGLALQRQRHERLAVHPINLLPRTHVLEGRALVLGRDAVRHPVTDTAAVEPENQARPLGIAAVMRRVNPEAAAEADESGALRLPEEEARPPHQGAVTEHPEFMAIRRIVPVEAAQGHTCLSRSPWSDAVRSPARPYPG